MSLVSVWNISRIYALRKQAAKDRNMASMKTLGKNINYSITGSKLTIEIDMSKDFGPSNSGKTIIVASSEGNKPVGDIKIGLNAYKYPDAKPVKAAKK